MSILTPPKVRRFIDPHHSPLLRFDWLLLLAVCAASGLGLAMVFSASHNHAKVSVTPSTLAPSYFLERQGIALAVGMLVCAAVFLLDYRKLLQLWPLAYGFTLVLLFAVRLVGFARGGTTAWFNIGPFQLQPSEFAKIIVLTGGENTSGGPGDSLLTTLLYVWLDAFRYHLFGYATAMAFGLFALILVFTLLNFAGQKRWVFYQEDRS